jgi:putative addiction module killer protein
METEIGYYTSSDGRRPVEVWFRGLPAPAAARVTTALTRLSLGNRSNVESVGGGVFELKIHHGPGYRVYFGNLNERLVLLLAGGAKDRQSSDITDAKARWADHHERLRKRRRDEGNDRPCR